MEAIASTSARQSRRAGAAACGWWLPCALAGAIVLCAPAVGQTQPGGASGAHTPREAGRIELVEGDAIIEAGGRSRLPRQGEALYEGDTITTFAKGELELHMSDGASLLVRENSKLTVTTYVAEGGANDASIIDLVQGAFRSITGWIGRFNRDRYQVHTPVATIGVRGTDHEPTYLPPGDPRGEPGAYDKVYEGQSFLRTTDGRVIDVPANRVAFHGRGAGAAPRLLASAPAFFRPGRNERQFVDRSRERVRTLQERREQRRQTLPGGPRSSNQPGAGPGRGQHAEKAAAPRRAEAPAPIRAQRGERSIQPPGADGRRGTDRPLPRDFSKDGRPGTDAAAQRRQEAEARLQGNRDARGGGRSGAGKAPSEGRGERGGAPQRRSGGR
jgi:hypothetical protein